MTNENTNKEGEEQPKNIGGLNDENAKKLGEALTASFNDNNAIPLNHFIKTLTTQKLKEGLERALESGEKLASSGYGSTCGNQNCSCGDDASIAILTAIKEEIEKLTKPKE